MNRVTTFTAGALATIAAQLSLSPRTVDGHLYRLFPKLGIASRAGLGKALRRYDSETDSGPHHTP